MAIAYHVHEFLIPTATNEEASNGTVSDKALVPSNLPPILSTKQDLSTALTSIAGLSTSANQTIYTTAENAYATTALTSIGRDVIGGSSAEVILGILGGGETGIDVFQAETAADIRDLLDLQLASQYNVLWGGVTGNGTTDDTTAIQSVVAAAFAGGYDLYWPVGDYLTTASIPNFHDVKHYGPGRIIRGTDTFYITQFEGVRNKLYVASTGNDANDGLSSSQPILTGQQAIDVWSKYAPVAEGPWTISLAAATYTEGLEADGIRSAFPLTIEGASKATTIIDGTGATKTAGINFNDGVLGLAKNLTVQDFSSNQIVFQNGARGTIDTCDAGGVTTFGFNASEGADMNIIGACSISVSTGGRGIRYYRNATGSLGDGTNTIAVSGGGNVADGLDIRNGSEVVANNGLVVDDFANVAVMLRNGGFLELRTATISNSAVGVSVDDQSRFAEVGPVTYAGNTLNKKFTGFGIQEGSTTNLLFGPDGPTGDAPTSGYHLVVDNAANTGLQFLTSGTSINIDFDKTERLNFDLSVHRATMVLNSANAYRWNPTSYIPIVDNAVSLGASGFRWSQLWAGTATINTSDAREKDWRSGLDEREIAVAKRLSRMIGIYRWKDAVEAKGEDARFHAGVTAQGVKEAFEAEGLDGFRYGILCFDAWEDQWEEIDALYDDVKSVEDEDGRVIEPATRRQIEPASRLLIKAAGDLYGVRYDELWSFVAAGFESRISALEAG